MNGYNKDMADNWKEALASREAQWNAFHRWESQRRVAAIPIEERVAWYVQAFRIYRGLPARADSVSTSARLAVIQTIREGLAHLSKP